VRTILAVPSLSLPAAGAAPGCFHCGLPVDPREPHLFGRTVEASRLAVYSLGFLLFWAFAAGSSALTCYLQLDAKDVNR